MITLLRRKQTNSKRARNNKPDKLAGTNVALVTYVYGRAVLHLNADEIAPRYSYLITMSRADATALRDQLNTFLSKQADADDLNETSTRRQPIYRLYWR